jgi:hypothetical protein
LDALAIDPAKPAELCHWCRKQPGLHLTGGWFHLVGSLVAGEDVMHWNGNSGTFRFEELVPGLEFGFSAQLALVREAFGGLPLLQLEFQTRVPWVLAEPEPGAEHVYGTKNHEAGPETCRRARRRCVPVAPPGQALPSAVDPETADRNDTSTCRALPPALLPSPVRQRHAHRSDRSRKSMNLTKKIAFADDPARGKILEKVVGNVRPAGA